MLIELLLAVTFVVGIGTLLSRDELAPKVAFAGSLLPLAVSLLMWMGFDGSGNALLGGKLAFETLVPWFSLGPYTLAWHVGVDGISFPLVVLTTVLTPLAVLSAWTPIDERKS